VAAGVVTVLVGFGVGFALGGRGPGTTDLDTAAVTTTTVGIAGGSANGDEGDAPAGTAAPRPAAPDPSDPPAPATTSTTAGASTSTTATTPPPAPTTSPPPTTRAVAPTTVVVTLPPPPTTTTTAPAPARLVAAWTQDAQGRLVIPRGGSATFTLTNVGGLQTQWLLTGTGFSGPGDTTVRGILDPGQTSPVTVIPAAGLPPGEVDGTISVLGPNPLLIPFVVV
jgi:hypothetical protein